MHSRTSGHFAERGYNQNAGQYCGPNDQSPHPQNPEDGVEFYHAPLYHLRNLVQLDAMGELPDGRALTQRDLIEFMIRVEMNMESFGARLVEFKTTLEQMTKRVDVATDDIRTDFARDLKEVQVKVSSLETSRTYQIAWLAGASFVGGLIIWAATKLFKL